MSPARRSPAARRRRTRASTRTTRSRTSRAASALRAKRSFKVGNAIFRKLWVSAPSSTQGSDGLGPALQFALLPELPPEGRPRPPAQRQLSRTTRRNRCSCASRSRRETDEQRRLIAEHKRELHRRADLRRAATGDGSPGPRQRRPHAHQLRGGADQARRRLDREPAAPDLLASRTSSTGRCTPRPCCRRASRRP